MRLTDKQYHVLSLFGRPIQGSMKTIYFTIPTERRLRIDMRYRKQINYLISIGFITYENGFYRLTKLGSVYYSDKEWSKHKSAMIKYMFSSLSVLNSLTINKRLKIEI